MEKQINMKGLAERLNISVSTVSRALRGHRDIGARTTAQVVKLANELNFQLNIQAAYLKTGISFTIGVIVPSLCEPYFTTALSGIEEVLEEKGFRVIVGQSRNCMIREQQIIQNMMASNVDGLIVAFSENTNQFGHFTSAEKKGIPIVFFDRIPPLPNINSVSCNTRRQTAVAIGILKSKGHNIIGLLNGPDHLLCSSEKKQAYMIGLKKQKISFQEAWIEGSELDEKSIVKAIVALLERNIKMTAVLAFDDQVALTAIKFLRSGSSHYTRHIDFIGYSNMPMMRYLDYIPIASIEQFPDEQGKQAAEMITRILAQQFRKENLTSFREKIIIEGALMQYS